MKPTPHASYSRLGSNSPLASGIAIASVRVLRSHGHLHQHLAKGRLSASLTAGPRVGAGAG